MAKINQSPLISLILDYYALCKPKVIAVMLVTTWVGMHLSSAHSISLSRLFCTLIGIALAGGSAAVINHLVDRHVDAKMSRTCKRPIASGRILIPHAILFAFILGVIGLGILLSFVNTLTAVLTFGTLLGYAVFYTLYLKRKTPQNIVIGGIAGATPPLLGWTAVSGEIHANALLLVLIIFIWTPPHFWSLAIYRRTEYQQANIPMLPVTHGVLFTKLCIVLYTILLFAITLLPFVTQMSGIPYLLAAMLLNTLFLTQTVILYKSQDEKTALKTFSFSITYLLLLFGALLIDHAL